MHGDKVAGCGAYSTTYHTYHRKNNYIIKCIKYNHSSKNINHYDMFNMGNNSNSSSYCYGFINNLYSSQIYNILK